MASYGFPPIDTGMIEMYKGVETITTVKPSTAQMNLTQGIAIPDIEAREQYVLPEYREFVQNIKKGI